jgi:hypothetical protein
LWFFAGAIALLGAIYPLNVAQRTTEHRSLSLVMAIFYLSLGMSFKKKYEKSLIEAPATPPNAKISQ